MLEVNEMNLCMNPYTCPTIHMDLTVTGNNRKVYEDALDSARYLNTTMQKDFIAKKILQSELGVDAGEPITNTVVIKTERTKAIINRSLTDQIDNVIFHNPATIVYWKDGTKTVVKANGEDVFDKETGLAMAIAKKALGNEGNYYETFKQWIPQLDRGASNDMSSYIRQNLKNLTRV